MHCIAPGASRTSNQPGTPAQRSPESTAALITNTSKRKCMLPPPQTGREHRGYYDPDEVSDEAKHSALGAWASSRTLEACLQAAPRSLHARLRQLKGQQL